MVCSCTVRGCVMRSSVEACRCMGGCHVVCSRCMMCSHTMVLMVMTCSMVMMLVVQWLLWWRWLQGRLLQRLRRDRWLLLLLLLQQRLRWRRHSRWWLGWRWLRGWRRCCGCRRWRLRLLQEVGRIAEAEVAKVAAHLLEHCNGDLPIQSGQEIPQETAAATTLSCFKLLKGAKEDICTRRFFPAISDVLMGIATTAVRPAPSTEPARATRALECETTHKVQKSLATPRTLQSQDILNNLVSHRSYTPLFFVKRLQTPKLSTKARLHLALQLCGTPLLKKVKPRLCITPENL
mmetsp:Transcript_106061/g.265626  ORF Transcript_106061/g.265626 Transcript_106061/m.265626 type:complete len:292 (+) Transcript_106061:3-878(+)